MRGFNLRRRAAGGGCGISEPASAYTKAAPFFTASGLDDDEDEGGGAHGGGARGQTNRPSRGARGASRRGGNRRTPRPLGRAVCSASVTRERNPRARIGGFTLKPVPQGRATRPRRGEGKKCGGAGEERRRRANPGHGIARATGGNPPRDPRGDRARSRARSPRRTRRARALAIRSSGEEARGTVPEAGASRRS